MKALYFLCILLIMVSCKDEGMQSYVLQGNAFGTTYNIQYFSSSEINTEIGIDSVLYAINKSVSTYMPNSDISKINRGDTTVIVDEIFKEVFRISEVVYTNSHGYFDPTIGVLRNAYGFGDTKPINSIDKGVVDSLMTYVGFKKVQLTKSGKVEKEYSEIYFDFNAVAKGYGIDRLGMYLESEGIANYLIELGGEILAKGKNLNKDKPWTVGIEAVSSSLEDRTYQATVNLTDLAMASSGNYRKFRIDSVSGVTYVHTINPLTGSAEQSDITSATVIASSCGVADAYATALMSMGLERSKELLKKTDGIEAFITYNETARIEKEYITEGFKKLLNQ